MAGISTMICVGTDDSTSRAAVELAEMHDEVWATVGLHPHDASALDVQWQSLVDLAAHPRVVAIGEAGFDLHYEHSPIEAQERAFREQIRLAHALEKALVIHTREAWADTFRVLDDEGMPARTIFHCFTGGPGEAAAVLERGGRLSFSGIVSFKGAHELRAAAAIVPLDRVMVETDAPYLTPEPHRGKPNEPALVTIVGEALARAMDLSPEVVAEAATETTRLVFGLN